MHTDEGNGRSLDATCLTRIQPAFILIVKLRLNLYATVLAYVCDDAFTVHLQENTAVRVMRVGTG